MSFVFFIWFSFAPVVYAQDEYSSDTARLMDAEDLELIVNKSFVLECHDNVFRVAVGNPNIADVQPLSGEKILINAVHAGWTNLIVWYDEDVTEAYNIRVGYDVGAVEKKLKELVPETAVTVTSSFAQALIVEGRVADQETMDRIMAVVESFVDREYIKNLMVLEGPQQVQLEARIVEVSRSELKRHGLSFLRYGEADGSLIGGGLLTPGGSEGGVGMSLSSAAGISQRLSLTRNTDGSTTSSTATGDSPFIAASNLNLSTPFTNAFQVALHLLNDDILGVLSLLKSQGVASVMARPTLVAMSGQAASFHVGGSFPVPATDDEGTPTFNNQNYGVMLEFVPTVTGRETIHLAVRTSVSDIDYATSVTSGGATVPGITTREASSALRLKDGQTFAIAGLLKEDVNTIVNKVPLLGELPIVGSLFRTKEYIKDETELIILVTPRLVTAMDPEEVPALPGEMENFRQDDFEFFFFDDIQKKAGGGPEKTPRFSGPAGLED